ncbi:YcnI family protein [Paenibacillus sp. NPDC058071]|uniref:YcnI family copper-binding membrane protein n=1 Tax=Paenibacillus sp. NPDC058071 TaxID=3346326 RepID=UPI0036D85F8E
MAKYRAGAALFAAFFLLLLAGRAEAHVTVSPQETTQGAYEVFTVRVPTEKASATTKVELIFPEGVEISRVQPLAGWQYAFQTEAGGGGKTSIVWTADGPGLVEGEFGEFKLQGKVADNAKELVWKAVQTYADGSVVEWAGGRESETPSSVTVVSKGTGDGHAASGHHAPAVTSSGGAEGGVSVSLFAAPAFYVALAALAAGLVALSISLRRTKRVA